VLSIPGTISPGRRGQLTREQVAEAARRDHTQKGSIPSSTRDPPSEMQSYYGTVLSRRGPQENYPDAVARHYGSAATVLLLTEVR